MSGIGNNFNLFSSMFSTSGSSGTSNMLGDLASIQNGSYKKLLKAYYKKQETGGESTAPTLSKTEKTELTTAKSDAESLKAAADKLAATGSKSLFKETIKTVTDENGVTKNVKEYDRDAIEKAIKEFAEKYNSVINSSLTPDNAQMTKKAALMANSTKMNQNLLKDIGITIGADYKLTVDEDKLKAADISTIKSLFHGAGSYASKVSQKAEDLNQIANKIITHESKGSYSSTGSYSNNLSTGNLFDGFF